MTSEFDTDTAVHDAGGGRFEADVTDRWSVGDKPNGGYLLAMAARAMGAALPKPDPVSLTAHFLRPPVPGPVTIDVELVRAGRAHATAVARMDQDGTERVRLLGGFGDLDAAQGPSTVLAEPPDLPPLTECVRSAATLPDGTPVALAKRFDSRLDPRTVGWFTGEASGRGEVRAWARLADGREPDVLAALLAVDGLPPTAFDLGLAGWVPTVELTCHVRNKPAPGWLRVAVATRFLTGGYLEEDAEVWDSEDRLVAQSRQLALVPRRVSRRD